MQPARPAPPVPVGQHQHHHSHARGRERERADRSEREREQRDRAPASIGDYEIVKTLGTGSFGKVKLAKHKLTGHRVAMKFISKRKISSKEMSDRVQREIQYLTLLSHPHIIKLYDVMSTPDYIVMVIEYLEGELFDYIVKRGRMPESEARRFFQQIICAVEYCHQFKIVHRDLKPENLLLDHMKNVKIADFGLSNVMRDGDFLKTSCGSPNYAAPEVISGKLYAGPEIDIWSCGVILYVMLCGRLPFDDDHIPLLFKKINGGIYSLPPFLSNDARGLLSRMLVVDSNKRITISEIRQTEWFKKDLPAYLQYPSLMQQDRLEKDLNLKEREKKHQQDGSGEATGTIGEEEDKVHGEYIKDVGLVDQEGVDELCAKIPGLTPEGVWESLRSGADKQLRIAYQLVRDSRSMGIDPRMMVTPPPTDTQQASRSEDVAGNTRKDSIRREGEDYFEEVDPLVTSNIKILETSLTTPVGEDTFSYPNRPLLKNRTGPLSSERIGPLTAAHRPDSERMSSPGPKKNRVRWHFGIRSRSEPLEVMLEIYRTLKTLGFEWKEKEPERQIHMQDYSLDQEDHARFTGHPDEVKKRKRREDEEFVKKAQALYFIETRCRLDDIMVRMDLQLYSIDEQNYLVDFRNLGYRRLRRSPLQGDQGAGVHFLEDEQNPEMDGAGTGVSTPVASESMRSGSSVSSSGLPADGSSMTARQMWEAAAKARMNATGSMVPEGKRKESFNGSRSGRASSKGKEEGHVSSPFLFLECACKLIVELAVGGSG